MCAMRFKKNILYFYVLKKRPRTSLYFLAVKRLCVKSINDYRPLAKKTTNSFKIEKTA